MVQVSEGAGSWRKIAGSDAAPWAGEGGGWLRRVAESRRLMIKKRLRGPVRKRDMESMG
jgi:hypothetical protein